jgi:hypothetical protein
MFLMSYRSLLQCQEWTLDNDKMIRHTDERELDMDDHDRSTESEIGAEVSLNSKGICGGASGELWSTQ